MILYTVMPLEQVFPEESTVYGKVKQVTFQGIPLMVEAEDFQYARVVRVLSTNPQDFLDERCCPGTKISFSFLEGLSS
ncbi:YlzJ-like family protein [Neobacillus terrae]|uniref:YlzJ-like family protein n=1 Tax=Neobacillus terrae TaxID=3034837 RepID=UPI00140746D8|nr:YlzJ-like family protein [Neobacillus terrae]NHM29853.1 ribonuclease [Neobacillus terrae]